MSDKNNAADRKNSDKIIKRCIMDISSATEKKMYVSCKRERKKNQTNMLLQTAIKLPLTYIFLFSCSYLLCTKIQVLISQKHSAN